MHPVIFSKLTFIRRQMALLLLALLSLYGAVACAPLPQVTQAKVDAMKRLSAPPGKARLYVHRESGLYGIAAMFPIVLDGRLLGKIRNGTFLAVDILPGKHDLWAIGADADIFNSRVVIELDAKPGEVYFVKHTFAGLAGNPRIELVDRERAAGQIRDGQFVRV